MVNHKLIVEFKSPPDPHVRYCMCDHTYEEDVKAYQFTFIKNDNSGGYSTVLCENCMSNFAKTLNRIVEEKIINDKTKITIEIDHSNEHVIIETEKGIEQHGTIENSVCI